MKILLCFMAVLGATSAGIPIGSSLCTLAKQFGRTTHTACLPTSQTGIPDDMKEAMLNKHNEYRAGVQPPAANMQKMVWDATLADLAQRWAEKCVWGHDSGADREVYGHFNTGQNGWSSTGSFNYLGAIDAWYNEVNLFTYGGSNVLKEVGHYTQVVWADSNRLGCGQATCGGNSRIFCNYSPAGNLDINFPYVQSDSRGSACPTKKTSDGLCDCGGAYCYSSGKLQNDCTCQCKTGSSVNDPNDYCKLVCPNPSEPNWNDNFCEVQKNKGNCAATWLNSVWCPVTCNTCPKLEGAYA